jgi:predicted NAD-dependent protein-ADP-ribosyltransferase YbiA (DUF1768 family)
MDKMPPRRAAVSPVELRVDGVYINGDEKVRYPGYLLFFSKSKSGLGRYLSNFWPSKVRYGGLVFPSVEHAYQAAKFRYIDPGSNDQEIQLADNLFRSLSIGGANGHLTALQAKKFGGKGSWKTQHCLPMVGASGQGGGASGQGGGAPAVRRKCLRIDVSRWGEAQIPLMTALMRDRMARDKLFRSIIRKAQQEGIALLHHDRAAARSFWGGAFDPNNRAHFRGRNTLGAIMMSI